MVAATLGLGLAAAGGGATAGAASLSQVTGQLGVNRAQLQHEHAHEQALSGEVSRYSNRIGRLDVRAGSLTARLGAAQAQLAAKRAELDRIEAQRARAHRRLLALQARLVRDARVLARHLVNGYESGQPDLVTVILDSHGFTDLLERVRFARLVENQDVRIIRTVRTERREVIALATRLGALQVREQAIAAEITAHVQEITALREQILVRRAALDRERARAAGDLAATRGARARLEARISALRAQQSRLQAPPPPPPPTPAAPSPAPSSGATPAPTPAPAPSSGGFSFPLPKGAASPPGTWSLDQGVDVAAPGHTPLYAVGSGTIVLHGIGGFGDWAPVLHLDDGRYVYYGHAGPGNAVAVGTHVSAGQVIGEVGAGIVGISTGPHLEIGFANASGGPIGPSTAPSMLALLQGSY